MAQQGKGRPILSWKASDTATAVVIGDTITLNDGVRTFVDVILRHMNGILGRDWWVQENAKQPAEQHPIVQWFGALKEWQRSQKEVQPGLFEGPMINLLEAYFGLAHNLYLIKHNAELKDLLVERLRCAEQFQGAFYELIVINLLVRAGFELALEDEVSRKSKHPELVATSRDTNRTYSVECKARAEAGVLGKTEGGTNPLKKLAHHLHEALGKPANGRERMIFIDLNTADSIEAKEPHWMSSAISKLVGAERRTSEQAYVFVTAFGAHRDLLSEARQIACLPFGLNIPTFGEQGELRLPDMFRRFHAHRDAHSVMDMMLSYPAIPQSFDGEIRDGPGFSVGDKINLHLPTGSIVGRVEAATVSEDESNMHILLRTPDGRAIPFSRPMTDAQRAEFRAHPETFFGIVMTDLRRPRTHFDHFRRIVDLNKHRPRSFFEQQLRPHLKPDTLASMTDEDLLLQFAEFDYWTRVERAKA